MDEDKKPWEQQPGEPDLWFRRFQEYLRQGVGRSMLAVANAGRERKGRSKRDNLSGAWRANVEKWRWPERASAFDEADNAQAELVWRQRREELREREHKLANALLDKAQQMLQFPLAEATQEQRDVNGQVVSITTVMPARWSMSDVAKFLETASKVARLAADAKSAAPDLSQFMDAQQADLLVRVLGASIVRRLDESLAVLQERLNGQPELLALLMAQLGAEGEFRTRVLDDMNSANPAQIIEGNPLPVPNEENR